MQRQREMERGSMGDVGGLVVASQQLALDGFENYRVLADETPPLFLICVGAYVALCIVLILPCVYKSRLKEKEGHQQLQQQQLQGNNNNNTPDGLEEGGGGGAAAVDDDDEPPGQEMVELMRNSAQTQEQHQHQEQHQQQEEAYDYTNRVKFTSKEQDQKQLQQNAANRDDTTTSHTSTRSASENGASPSQQQTSALVRPLSTTEDHAYSSASAPAEESPAMNGSHNASQATSWPPPPRTLAAAAAAAATLNSNANDDDRHSSVPSVASTSRLMRRRTPASMPGGLRAPHAGSGVGGVATSDSNDAQQQQEQHLRRPGRKYPVRSWDFSSRMRWNQGQPLTPAESIRRSVRLERQSQASEEGSQASRMSYGSRTGHHRTPSLSRGVGGRSSDAASRSLVAERVQGEAEFYRQRYRERHVLRRSPSAASGMSLMPPLSPDELSPEDAADAHDVGTAQRLEDFPNFRPHQSTAGEGSSNTTRKRSNALTRALDCVLDLAEPDYETRRILKLAMPATLASMAEPLFRLVLVAIISHFVDTDSMVAYVLTILFVRLTTAEISSVLADAESTLVQQALGQGGDLGFVQAGRCVQVALLVQVLLGIGMLMLWGRLMEDVVYWLIGNRHMAALAGEYAGIIVLDYILRGATRIFMLPFHLTGQGSFEKNIDVGSTLLTVIAIATVAALHEEDHQHQLTLKTIGRIQVILGIAKTIIKVAYVVLKGWLQPYKLGLLSLKSLMDTRTVCSFMLQALPLLIGSVIEIGEWELLILVVRHVGGAEVAAWAMMGIIWEVCGAATEGLGEASAVRVSFYLEEGMPFMAQRLSNKVALLASVEALAVTSIFYIVGPNVAISLTRDSTLQHLLDNLIGMTGLANIAMTFAQTLWSLTGAQNRFSLASATILTCRWFVMAPVALVCVFVFSLDNLSLAGAVALGYATAAVYLARCVFQCNWEEILMPLDDDDLNMSEEEYESEEEDDDDDEEDSDDDDSSVVF